MARRTYVNAIEDVEVALAIERVLIANYPQSFTPARINLDALPSGFYDLGSVKEDTPSFKVSREKFSLKVGIPMTTAFEQIMGIAGNLSLQLNSNSWRKAQFAFGNLTSTASAVTVATIASVTNESVFTLTTTPSTPLAVCRQIILAANTAGFDAPDAIETRIASITTNGLTFKLSTVPRTLVAGQHIGIYDYVTQPIGTSNIRYYTVLGVADFTDGVQVVHELFKVSPGGGDWEEAFRPNANGLMALNFEALGVAKTINGCSQLVVGNRHYFPTATCECL